MVRTLAGLVLSVRDDAGLARRVTAPAFGMAVVTRALTLPPSILLEFHRGHRHCPSAITTSYAGPG